MAKAAHNHGNLIMLKGLRYLLIIFVLWVGLSGCSRPYYTETCLMMGTFAKITCQDQEAIGAAFKEMSRVDAIADNFDSSSEISRLNKTGKLKASGDMMDLVKNSLKYYELTNGAFDITVGPVVDVWKQKIEEARGNKIQALLPSPADIDAKLRLIGSEKISVDETTSVITFNQPGMEIDLGGIAKGYAVDKAVERLKTLGVTSALVDLGGTIYCLGRKGNKKWRIAIRDPRHNDRILHPLELENRAVATSGDYEQFFMVKGKRYSHIIDPKTGYPVNNGVISVTIIADSAIAADVMSTAGVVLGKEKAESLAEGMNEIVEIKILREKDLL
ncbi:FAD:protein FMN transferase [bacterium]|jgi:thiamine biosynthesis lipoprotein|nr:FAD:protein FMN transferase [bacterium]